MTSKTERVPTNVLFTMTIIKSAQQKDGKLLK